MNQQPKNIIDYSQIKIIEHSPPNIKQDKENIENELYYIFAKYIIQK